MVVTCHLIQPHVSHCLPLNLCFKIQKISETQKASNTCCWLNKLCHFSFDTTLRSATAAFYPTWQVYVGSSNKGPTGNQRKLLLKLPFILVAEPVLRLVKRKILASYMRLFFYQGNHNPFFAGCFREGSWLLWRVVLPFRLCKGKIHLYTTLYNYTCHAMQYIWRIQCSAVALARYFTVHYAMPCSTYAVQWLLQDVEMTYGRPLPPNPNSVHCPTNWGLPTWLRVQIRSSQIRGSKGRGFADRGLEERGARWDGACRSGGLCTLTYQLNPYWEGFAGWQWEDGIGKWVGRLQKQSSKSTTNHIIISTSTWSVCTMIIPRSAIVCHSSSSTLLVVPLVLVVVVVLVLVVMVMVPLVVVVVGVGGHDHHPILLSS